MNFTVNEVAKYYTIRVRMGYSENSPIYVVIRERCLDS